MRSIDPASFNLPSIGHREIATEITTAGFSGWGIYLK